MRISWNICGILLLILAIVAPSIGVQESPKRKSPIIFNFGDSNSDTGAIPALGGIISSPYGQTFFGHPAGRYSDGRLIIDFIAERLKIPQLMSGYLDLHSTNFRNGANFAVAGACAVSWNPSHMGLENQVLKFIDFKARVKAIYDELSSKKPEEAETITSRLPTLKDFDEALYMIDIAQNDLANMLHYAPVKFVAFALPDVISKFDKVIEQLYKEGARHFWIHNTGPVGCLPDTLTNINSSKSELNFDQYGCIETANDIAKKFNEQLKSELSQLSKKFPELVITYVDMYTAKYELITAANKQGFEDPLASCWPEVNKTRLQPCDDPSKHISYDGTHYTEAANKIVAERIVNGLLSVPQTSIEEACGV